MNRGKNHKLIVGVDIGGSKIALGLGDFAGTLRERREFPTPAEPNPATERIAAQIMDMLAAAGTGPGALAGIGLGCAGPLDQEAGTVLNAPNLPRWANFPLRGAVAGWFDCPVWLENDANAAALGEHRFGSGQGFADMVYVTLSTGIGGGIIINNQLLRGQGGGAGEIGHMTILPDGPLCNCGNRGCLEALASGPAIARRARERLAAGGSSRLYEMAGGDPAAITSKTVAAAAAAGDRLAGEILAETIEYIGIGLGNVVTMLNPEAVIIGGGVAKIGRYLLAGAREIIGRRVRLVPPPAVLPSGLDGDVGIYGALSLALYHLKARPPEKEQRRERRYRWEGED
ncbi:MAG: ROK family protein [bacterium]|jgi:glucokinase